jgi:hypothetical protein
MARRENVRGASHSLACYTSQGHGSLMTRQWLSRCVRIVCGGWGARSALLQARGGAGIGRGPAMAWCLQVGVLSAV